MTNTNSKFSAALVSVFAAAVLGACGGGSGNGGNAASQVNPVAAPLATGMTTLDIGNQVLAIAESPAAVPAFHAAPVIPDEPDDRDAQYNAASANQPPHRHAIRTEFAGLATRQLTLQDMYDGHDHWGAGATAAAEGVAAPMAAAAAAVAYAPAQIRSAYSLPVLPVAGVTPSATQAAQMGAGQTIYIVDAMNDPNAAAELAAFNTKFGLPGCTTLAISATAKLPLAAAPTTNPGCTLSVVYSTPSGTMTTTAPAYNSGWATEIALDVQWAHATAPLARIILIESADASLGGLLGGVNLANAMGPGAVSMSFGSAEGNWTSSVDSAFMGANMTYLAAAGDSGAGVSWPAVSSHVIAVGGTSLSYSGTGTRTETAWSGTGGGVSAYVATPSYQINAVPGLGSVAHRSVTDVSFNADPYTGQYIAVIPSGSSTAGWMVVGGTSLSTPQWAGIVAVANAERALAAKPALGAPHAALYTQIATVPGTYASDFGDIVKGSDGGCTLCVARTGYDQPTGLGTPNTTSMLSVLVGTAPAPVVTSASIGGTAGTPLSFMVSVTAANPVSYSLAGAPPGMSINVTGAVTWTAPLAGTYVVTVTATDIPTRMSGQGTYTVSISPPTAPVVTAATINGTVGQALTFPVYVTAPTSDPLTYALSGAPSGMAVGTTGTVAWAAPAAGTYAVTASVKDTKTGLTGQGVYTVKIVAAPIPAPTGPVITAAPMTGVAGKLLTGTISLADSGVASLSVSISGAPMGMTFSVSGMSVIAKWTSPVTGNYSLKVVVLDSAGHSAQATIPVTVTAH